MSLSTKNIPDSKLSKTIGPGQVTAKLNRIELVPGYKDDSYKVLLHLEGEDLGEDFEGFFKDAETKSGERYKGQVGRIKMSRYDYADGETKSGIAVKRDINILRGLTNIAKATGVSDELDAISADTIEEYVPLAEALLTRDNKFLNFVVSGKEYQAGEYVNYELFLAVPDKGKVSVEAADIDAKDSKLVEFDEAKHIIRLAPAAPVESFEPKDTFQL